MEERSINFLVTNKTKSIPLHQVLNSEGLIILDLLMVKDLKGIMPLEFSLKSSNDSPTIMAPMFFTLVKPNPFHNNLTITSDSFAIFFFEKMKVDCKRIKLEIEIVMPKQNENGSLHYATLQYKTFGGGDGNDSLPVNPKIEITQKITI